MNLGSSVHCTPMFGNYLGLAQFTSPQHSTIYLFPWLNCDLKVVFSPTKGFTASSLGRSIDNTFNPTVASSAILGS